MCQFKDALFTDGDHSFDMLMIQDGCNIGNKINIWGYREKKDSTV